VYVALAIFRQIYIGPMVDMRNAPIDIPLFGGPQEREGLPGLPYLDHLLRGLRSEPPSYVSHVVAGGQPPGWLSEHVAGVVLVDVA
jgi:hypothetical protein